MHVLIMGATGGTGAKLVERALEAGHTVRVLVRDRARLHHSHARLEVMVGDALNPDDVARAVAGQDVVVSALGAPAMARTAIRAETARVIVEAMRAQGVARLISVSSMGVGSSYAHVPWVYKYLIIPFYLKRAFQDHALQEACIQGSELAWTIVRPPALTDAPASDDIAHGVDLTMAAIMADISRDDVAAFIMTQLDERDYVGKAVTVGRVRGASRF